jgi:hypothetical protein
MMEVGMYFVSIMCRNVRRRFWYFTYDLGCSCS